MHHAVGKVLENRGTPQSWLARRLGISRSYLNHILAGRRTYPADLKSKTAVILGVPEHELFEDDDDQLHAA